MTKVSIITINKNNKDGLRKTMQSVLDQDFDDFEYIVVDGASDDGSVEVIQEFEALFKQKRVPFQYESKPDRGIFHAMNKGIVRAEGEYLLFLNSGDYLVAPAVLTSFTQFGATEDFVAGNIMVHVDGRDEIRKNPEKVDFLFFYSVGALHHQATFVKRNVFDRFGMYNENNKISSDWEHSLRSIVVGGASYRHVELTVSHYDITGISSNEAFRSISIYEGRRVYLSLMPEYVLDALDHFRKEKCEWGAKQKLYDEYMTIKEGKWRFLINIILRIKKVKRKYSRIR